MAVDDYHIDAMAAHLVRRAKDFDVIVTENMYGDILSDLAGELVGSLGLAPSINSNEKLAMAQAAHGSAPDITGLNIGNPTGIMLSTVIKFCIAHEWRFQLNSDDGADQCKSEQYTDNTCSQSEEDKHSANQFNRCDDIRHKAWKAYAAEKLDGALHSLKF